MRPISVSNSYQYPTALPQNCNRDRMQKLVPRESNSGLRCNGKRSNFRQPQIAAGKKADFVVVNHMETGRICSKPRYSLIRQPLGFLQNWRLAEAEIDTFSRVW